MPSAGTLDPAVTTGRPGGGVSCATTTQNDSTCVLDATGVHSLTVADAAGTKPGHYAISVQRLNDPVACGQALSFSGNATAESLAVAGDSECHRFSATAGDRVRVNWQATTSGLNPFVEVVRARRQHAVRHDRRPADLRCARHRHVHAAGPRPAPRWLRGLPAAAPEPRRLHESRLGLRAAHARHRGRRRRALLPRPRGFGSAAARARDPRLRRDADPDRGGAAAGRHHPLRRDGGGRPHVHARQERQPHHPRPRRRAVRERAASRSRCSGSTPRRAVRRTRSGPSRRRTCSIPATWSVIASTPRTATSCASGSGLAAARRACAPPSS